MAKTTKRKRSLTKSECIAIAIDCETLHKAIDNLLADENAIIPQSMREDIKAIKMQATESLNPIWKTFNSGDL